MLVSNRVEDPIRKITLSLIGAAAVAASVLLVRQQREVTPPELPKIDSSEKTTERPVSLERLRELGI